MNIIRDTIESIRDFPSDHILPIIQDGWRIAQKIPRELREMWREGAVGKGLAVLFTVLGGALGFLATSIAAGIVDSIVKLDKKTDKHAVVDKWFTKEVIPAHTTTNYIQVGKVSVPQVIHHPKQTILHFTVKTEKGEFNTDRAVYKSAKENGTITLTTYKTLSGTLQARTPKEKELPGYVPEKNIFKRYKKSALALLGVGTLLTTHEATKETKTVHVRVLYPEVNIVEVESLPSPGNRKEQSKFAESVVELADGHRGTYEVEAQKSAVSYWRAKSIKPATTYSEDIEVEKSTGSNYRGY